MKSTHPTLPIVAALLVGSLATASADEAPGTSTISPTANYAYSANTGSLNFRPSPADGAQVGESFLSGYIWAANTAWIHLGDNSPANGYSYSQSAVDYGVNHDGSGNLSGYAYSANTGWINFGWTTINHPERPRFNLRTGQFSGYAYGANTGWISLEAAELTTDSMTLEDCDNDGISDPWEMRHWGDLTSATGISDSDADGHSDVDEYLANTDPRDSAIYLQITSLDANPNTGKVSLVFTANASRLYRVELSNDLGSSDPWTAIDTTFRPSAGQLSFSGSSILNQPRKFMRIIAVRPLTPITQPSDQP